MAHEKVGGRQRLFAGTDLDYAASYAHDPLDNLTQVTQGVQTRTFVHDALNRPTHRLRARCRGRNPSVSTG